MKQPAARQVLAALGAGLLAAARGGDSRGNSCDYAESSHVDDWLRHPVYGDPSFDSFRRLPNNPIHRGSPPFDWPVNGFFFPDPQGTNWYVFIGDYGKGYLNPPSRCLLYRSPDRGVTWTNLGPVIQGDPTLFDKGGHTPDASVVYDQGRYHMVYDWGEPNFAVEGGLAYAWAERPEGPWHRATQPITRNSSLPRLLGRYQRTYAGTLVKRAHDWLILGMMDHAPYSWALFAITASEPSGPYSDRRLVRDVEGDGFHPALMEFFPAFSAGGFVFAPATSVALNRNFNALFRASLEQADRPEAWSLVRYGSLWHSEDVEAERFGIWGQTFSGQVGQDGVLTVLFPSRDANGRGTIHLAQREWNQALNPRGFVLSGHLGPSLTLLRKAYAGFLLEAQWRLRGEASLLLDFDAPLGPNTPTSDATLHPLVGTRQVALQFSLNQWRLVRYLDSGKAEPIAAGDLTPKLDRTVRFDRQADLDRLALDGREVWSGRLGTNRTHSSSGVVGFRVEKDSHLEVERFRIQGQPEPARIGFLYSDALLGAGASPQEWGEVSVAGFRFGIGATSKQNDARAKWNVIGTGLKLWSPSGPDYGTVEVRLDGQIMARIDLHTERAVPSTVVWTSARLPDTYHALVLQATSGRAPLDCLEVTTGP